jgi:protein-S-isoprenylcysteine O-methyltransferase Ste14
VTARTRFAIVGVFVIATLGAAGGAQALQRIASLPPVPTHAALWLAWFSWHSVVFPRARRRALRGDRDAAYRAVFPTQILPGVCIGVSLMGGPALHAVLAGAPLASPHQLAVGAAFLLAGATLLLSGFVSIGVASAGFLYEYVDTTEPIVPRGIYGYIRHPLFFGGVLASIGAALAFATPVAVAGAAVNVTALPLYRLLEDRRLAEVFGMSYRLYSVEVAAFLPWLRAVRIAAERVGR